MIRSTTQPRSARRRRFPGAVIVAALLLASTAACQRTTLPGPDLAEAHPDAPSEAAFWDALRSRSAVNNNEGFHGVLILADGEDSAADYPARVALLKERGWLDSDFDEPSALAIQRGTLAKGLAHAISLRGGVMYSITGPSPRYALRELVDRGIMPPGSTRQSISGGEFLGVLGKAQDAKWAREGKTVGPDFPIPQPPPPERAAPAPGR